MKTTLGNEKMFKWAPEGFREVLESNINLMVISTLDKTMTIRKIEENSNGHNVYTHQQFSKYVYTSQRNFTDNLIPVVNCDEDNFEGALEAACDLGRKVCFVTSLPVDLINGFTDKIKSYNIKVSRDVFDWKYVTPTGKNGIKSKLEKLYGNKVVRLLIHHLTGAPTKKSELFLLDVMLNRSPWVFHKTIPSEIPFYTSRQLIPRNNISPEVFRMHLQDIFLIEGIELGATYDFAESIDLSSNIIKYHEITTRFVLLQHASHFDEICNILPRSNSPVHLFHQSQGEFTWKRSKGSIEALQKFVEKSQNSMNESDFLESIMNNQWRASNRIILISDSAGMGKTIFLERIGRLIQARYPKRLVIFIGIGKFMDQLSQELQVTSNKSAAIKNTILEIICSNCFGKVIAKSLLEDAADDNVTELLFDGFDEVSVDNIKSTRDIIKDIVQSFGSIRIWITTRPILLQPLEKHLKTLGYNLQPFSMSEQVRFFCRYWEADQNYPDHSEKFATSLLQNIHNLSSAENDIAGVPLLCMLIADVFKSDALSYCKSNPLFDPPISRISIEKLFRRFIDKKMEIYMERYVQDHDDEWSKVLRAYKYLSVKLILPKNPTALVGDFEIDLLLWEKLQAPGILKIGSSINSPIFLHRTFAEYFVARVAFQKIQQGSWYDIFSSGIFKTRDCTREKFISIYMELNVKEFEHSVICYFLDCLLRDFTEAENNAASQELLAKNQIFFKVVEIAQACIYHNFKNLFTAMRSLQIFRHLAPTIYDEQTLTTCMLWSGLPLAKLVCLDYKEVASGNDPSVVVLHLPPSPQPTKISLLIPAAFAGNIGVVMYLLHSHGFKHNLTSPENRLVLHWCVSWSSKITCSGIINDKIQIIKALVSIDRQLLNESTYSSKLLTPLLCYSIHPRLLIELISNGADITACGSDGKTFFHLATEYLPIVMYEDLLQGLIEMCETLGPGFRSIVASIINKPFCQRRSACPFLYGLFSTGKIPTPQALDYLEELGADFKVDVESFKSIVLEYIVCEQPSLTFIRELARRCGCEENVLSSVDSNGDNMLHRLFRDRYPALMGVQMFVKEYGLDLFAENREGNTPMNYFLKLHRGMVYNRYKCRIL